MDAKIEWPKSSKAVKTSHGAFVAFGRTHGTIAGLSWTCTSKADPSAVIPSRLIPAAPAGGGQQKWAIGFRVPAAGRYQLDVAGEDGRPDSVTFQVDFVFGAMISWPDEADITDYADDFAPYGPLTTNQIGDVTLLDEVSLTPVDLLVPAFGDPSVLELWVAQFDAIPRGHTYKLHAEDDHHLGDDRTGLIVRAAGSAHGSVQRATD